jgi:hypothetical protein
MSAKFINIWLEQGLELYLNHYKYWNNYNDSTVLVDNSYNIIAFFDRKTEEIYPIMINYTYNKNYILANWKIVKLPITRYKPLARNDVYIKYKNNIAQKSEIEKCKQYNINYFNNLLKWK